MAELKPTRKSNPGNIYDAFAKQMFSRIFMIIDFLRNYADENFVAEINLKRIRPAPTHYFGHDGKERIADLVFQCPLKAGGDRMAVIVFEHQSSALALTKFGMRNSPNP